MRVLDLFSGIGGFFWHKWRMLAHYERMRPIFPYAGPQQFEIDYLNKIWEGRE
jgi:hypothetical protein